MNPSQHFLALIAAASVCAAGASAFAQPAPQLQPASQAPVAAPEAQPQAPWGPTAPQPQPWRAPAVMTAPYPPAPAIPFTPQNRTERVLIELGGGAGAGLVLGVAGLYLGFLAGTAALADRRGSSSVSGFFVAGAYGGVLGASLGIPLGVYLVGNNYHGNGGLGWTYLCSAVGGAAAFGLAYAAESGDIGVGIPIVAGLFLPLTGAVLGYELSSDADERSTRTPAPAAPTVAPVVTATAGLGLVGVAGSF